MHFQNKEYHKRYIIMYFQNKAYRNAIS